MATRRKYRLKKKVKNFLIFYTFICVTFFASYTFSRYIDTTTNTFQIGIAKFNVLVNDKNVTDNEPFLLNLSANANTLDNKIAPSVEDGYFAIIINPKGTEVSLEYSFVFDLSNLDEEINLVKYTINDGEDMSLNDNIISGDLLLPSGEAFKDGDEVVIKVYWEWNTDITNPDITKLNDNISVISTIKQKIS